MKITVERCWSGSCWKWRLVAPDHKWFLLSCDEGELVAGCHKGTRIA